MDAINVSAEVISTVNKLLVEGFELPAEKLDANALLGADLGLDSLDAVDMLVHMEESLGIKVEGEKLQNLRTLNDVYALATEALSRTKSVDLGTAESPAQ